MLGEPKFRVGDYVTYTNDQGVKFPGKRIVAVAQREKGWHYEIAPTDTPWMEFPERNLHIADAPTGNPDCW